MSKKTQTSTPKLCLVELKLAVVNYHAGEHNEYLRSAVARDACYTSNNSINYKTEQMSKVKAELASLMEGEGSEVVDINIAKKVEIYNSMDMELDELMLRHKADLEVFHKITGEEWSYRRKSKVTQNQQGVLEAARAILG
jgi:hypothetical protein